MSPCDNMREAHLQPDKFYQILGIIYTKQPNTNFVRQEKNEIKNFFCLTDQQVIIIILFLELFFPCSPRPHLYMTV